MWIYFLIPKLVSDDIATTMKTVRRAINLSFQQEQVSVVLDTPNYFFVSRQLAKEFPSLFESSIVLAFHSYFPPGDLDTLTVWNDDSNTRGLSDNEVSVRVNPNRKRKLLMRFVQRFNLSIFVLATIQYLGTIPIRFQQPIVHTLQPIIFSFVIVVYFFMEKHPLFALLPLIIFLYEAITYAYRQKYVTKKPMPAINNVTKNSNSIDNFVSKTNSMDQQHAQDQNQGNNWRFSNISFAAENSVDCSGAKGDGKMDDGGRKNVLLIEKDKNNRNTENFDQDQHAGAGLIETADTDVQLNHLVPMGARGGIKGSRASNKVAVTDENTTDSDNRDHNQNHSERKSRNRKITNINIKNNNGSSVDVHLKHHAENKNVTCMGPFVSHRDCDCSDHGNSDHIKSNDINLAAKVVTKAPVEAAYHHRIDDSDDSDIDLDIDLGVNLETDADNAPPSVTKKAMYLLQKDLEEAEYAVKNFSPAKLLTYYKERSIQRKKSKTFNAEDRSSVSSSHEPDALNVDMMPSSAADINDDLERCESDNGEQKVNLDSDTSDENFVTVMNRVATRRDDSDSDIDSDIDINVNVGPISVTKKAILLLNKDLDQAEYAVKNFSPSKLLSYYKERSTQRKKRKEMFNTEDGISVCSSSASDDLLDDFQDQSLGTNKTKAVGGNDSERGNDYFQI